VKVSIIIPLYNKGAYIERALASIAAQSFADYEVIVVDDGSTDDGPAKVQSWKDPRVRLIQQANAGPGPARNRGISQAQGELIAFLDADDEWLPEFLAQSVQILESQGPEVASITSGYYEWPAQISREPLWRQRGLTPGVHRITPATPALLVVHMLAYMCPWSTVIRADVLRRLGGFFDRERCLYAEDAYLWLQVLLHYPVAFNMTPLVRFHTEASSLSKNLTKVRPVEPFLLYPDEIETRCPGDLRDLLREVLAIRAQKTACVLGYWGQWRQAHALRARFSVPCPWRLPYYWPALICATPLGKWLGSATRLAAGLWRARTGSLQKK
jgi:glycosyltransferase involved in cell wall biosynthesis